MARVLRAGVAILLFASLAACSGSDDETARISTQTPSQSAESLPLTETCPMLQEALDANVAGDDEDWAGLAADVDEIADQAALEDAPLFSEIAVTSANFDDPTDPLVSQGEWLDAMEVIQDRCQAAGAPLD